MTEKQVIDLVIHDLKTQYEGCEVWRAPAFKKMRWDVFNCFDLVVALKVGQPIFVQVTTTPNLSARRKKIKQFFEDTGVNLQAKIYAYDKIGMTFKIECVRSGYGVPITHGV